MQTLILIIKKIIFLLNFPSKIVNKKIIDDHRVKDTLKKPSKNLNTQHFQQQFSQNI